MTRAIVISGRKQLSLRNLKALVRGTARAALQNIDRILLADIIITNSEQDHRTLVQAKIDGGAQVRSYRILHTT